MHASVRTVVISGLHLYRSPFFRKKFIRVTNYINFKSCSLTKNSDIKEPEIQTGTDLQRVWTKINTAVGDLAFWFSVIACPLCPM